MKFRQRSKLVFAVFMVVAALLVGTGPASGELQLLQPDPAVGATFVGQAAYSADGLGQSGPGGTVQAEVPAGSTVELAYLYSSYFASLPDAAALTLDFDGTVVNLALIGSIEIVPGFFLSSARADVTAQVAAKVGGGGGITDFAVNSDPVNMDGVALVVIYSNPSLPQATIAVLDGAQVTTGDTATFNFAQPLDTTVPGFAAQMSLGIGFGFQFDGIGSDCGTGQFSEVDVNGQRLTSCAGSYDDGFGSNGGLITVGGVGDSLDNPADPFAVGTGTDDELYNLVPFLSDGDTSLTIETRNPSNDDIIFLSVISITAEAVVTSEICDDGIDNDGDGLVDADDPDCTIDPPDPENSAYMTGGGSVENATLGFVVHCDVLPGEANNLQINWGSRRDRHRFHLEELTDAGCDDDPEISEGSPVAGFDTASGAGIGRLDGVDGATAEWVMADAGEPGRNDTISLVVKNADGDVVLDVSGTLRSGNTQAHPASD